MAYRPIQPATTIASTMPISSGAALLARASIDFILADAIARLIPGGARTGARAPPVHRTASRARTVGSWTRDFSSTEQSDEFLYRVPSQPRMDLVALHRPVVPHRVSKETGDVLHRKLVILLHRALEREAVVVADPLLH